MQAEAVVVRVVVNDDVTVQAGAGATVEHDDSRKESVKTKFDYTKKDTPRRSVTGTGMMFNEESIS